MSDFNFHTDHESLRFSLYAAGGRIYAQNAQSVLIDIGSVALADDGFRYRIEGDAALSGRGFAGADDVLRDLSSHIDRAFLDTRFQVLPDRSEDYSVDLNGASHRMVELAPSAALSHATPLHRMVAPRATASLRFAR